MGMSISVLLSGRLYLKGYGNGKKAIAPAWFALEVEEGQTVEGVIQAMEVPPEEVALAMVNGKKCGREMEVRDGDRVALLPSDVAALWDFVSAWV